MSYAIFRCQSINTLNYLSHIGSHNKREKESYKSNPDIRKIVNIIFNQLNVIKNIEKNFMKLLKNIEKNTKKK